jgi:competence protein ComEC
VTGVLAGGAVLSAAWFGWLGLPLALAMIGLWYALAGSRPHAAATACLVLALSALMAFKAVPAPVPAQLPWAGEATALRGVVATAPARGSSFDTFSLDVSEAEIDETWQQVSGRVCVVAPRESPVSLADRIWLAGEPASIEDESERIRGFLTARGCGGSVFGRAVSVDAEGTGWRRTMAAARDRFSATIRSLAPGDAGALMSGLVTGADDALSSERKDAFLATGTTHITAVSGSNFATVVTVLLGTGAATGLRRNRVWLGVVVAAIWAYALFVGLEAPAFRAALAATGAVIGLRAGRRPDVVTLNVIAAAVMALVVPEIVWSLGFQLSLVAALALAMTASTGMESDWWTAIRSALVASAIAQIATLPLLLPLRGDLPFVSLPANLVIGPLVALAFPLSAVAGIAGTLWFPAGEALALPAFLATDGILRVVDWFAAAGVVLRVGTVEWPVALIIGIGAGAAVFAVSESGQRAWRQWPERFARMGEARRAALAGSLAGLLLAAGVMLGTAW